MCAQPIQSKLPFQSIPREQWLAQEKMRFVATLEERNANLETQKLLEECRKVKRREYERAKERRQRDRRREIRSQMGLPTLDRRLKVLCSIHFTGSFP
jgi:hypothetical protein